jgi:hypothetical protein
MIAKRFSRDADFADNPIHFTGRGIVKILEWTAAAPSGQPGYARLPPFLNLCDLRDPRPVSDLQIPRPLKIIRVIGAPSTRSTHTPR